MTVNSDPMGADCLLTREGEGIGTASPTPETLIVDRGDEDIIVSCKKDGYLTSEAILPSELEAMTFGNILFGGLIGVAVDAASDANAHYPESIVVELVPENFPSELERDRFFDGRKEDALRTFESAEQELAARCDNTQRPAELCEKDEVEMQEALDRKLQDIERMRLEAKVGAAD